MDGSPPLPRHPRAVLLDALGTLVALAPPAPALREELAARGAPALSAGQAEAAVAREIAYYRLHLMEGRDPASLADLRRRCAEELRTALPAAVRPSPTVARAALLGALRFAAFAEVPEALERLRAHGLALVVVSNWDVGLGEVLERVGLAGRVDAVVTAAAVGRAKPDPEPFRRALARAGVAPGEAVHVGDSPGEDAAGARAAGVAPILVVRGGAPPPAAGAWARDLAEVAAVLTGTSGVPSP